jgi:hypothetical protein
MDESEKNDKTETESQDNDHRDSENSSEQDNEESKQSSPEHHRGPIHDEAFNDEDIQNLKDIFDLFDKDQSGKIEASDLENILTSLKRDPEEAHQMLNDIDPNHDGQITFDEFLDLMRNIENKLDKKDDHHDHETEKQDHDPVDGKSANKRTTIQTDSRVLDFLILLEDYRSKCESEGKYAEARKARLKYEELLRKETIRQKNNIRIAQEQELQSIENAQRAQFLEFSQAWDNYMSDYEATAYLSLEKLKEKHVLELKQFKEN